MKLKESIRRVGKLLHRISNYIKKRIYSYLLLRYQEFARKLNLEAKDNVANRALRNVKQKRSLTPQQKKEITDFYKGLTGQKVSLSDHVYFYSRTGVYAKDYMPRGLYETEILGRANRLDCYNSSYCDKNLNEMLLPGIKHPHSYLKNINGYYYYEGRPVGMDEAAFLCQDLQDVIVKPSKGHGGQGVRRLSFKDGRTISGGHTLLDLFAAYHRDFLIQESVKQHPLISALNPTSVNTLRIMTYRSGMEVMVVYSAIRIGRQDQVIDNQKSGGMSTVIHPDGKLGKYAFGKAGYDMLEKTDTGIVLEGYQLPYFDQAIETVKNLHYSLPLFDIVGWDISINEEGEPVLIEWNGCPDPSQTACGTGLGALTERIIKEVWPRENTRFYDPPKYFYRARRRSAH